MTDVNRNVEEIIDIAEDLGWKCIKDEKWLEFYQFSPAGEDFGFSVDIDDAVRQVSEYADSFDEGEHISMWIDARGANVRGIPDNEVLIKDAKAIKLMLQKLASALNKENSRYQIIDLETILRDDFGCKRPLYKNPKVKKGNGYFYDEYEYLTVSGSKAYTKLVQVVYHLEELLGSLVDANTIIEELDSIVDSKQY